MLGDMEIGERVVGDVELGEALAEMMEKKGLGGDGLEGDVE